jgi:protein-S-isoprenylcysteine O-methyltransferase
MNSHAVYYLLDLLVISEVGLALSRRSSAAAGAEGRRSDRGSMRMLWIVTTLAITGAFEIAGHDIGPFLMPAANWRIAGVALFALGLMLRIWSIYHLGRFFTVDVTIAHDHRVVDDGPYRFVRHPSYSALLLEFAGIGLALRSVPGWLVLMLPIFLVLLHRVRIEEAALIRALGEPYLAYKRRTKRFVPGIF